MSSFGTGHSAHVLKSEKLKQDYLISTTDTIDSLIQSKFIEIPNYIKIDTHGNEKEILLGMEETLRSNIVKSILVELDFIEDLNFVKDYLKNIILILRMIILMEIGILFSKKKVDLIV